MSNSALAAVCVWSGLQQHLLFESHHLADSIQVYADKLKASQNKEYAVAAQENRSPGQFWLEIEPPKVAKIPNKAFLRLSLLDCRRYRTWSSPSLGPSIYQRTFRLLAQKPFSTMS